MDEHVSWIPHKALISQFLTGPEQKTSLHVLEDQAPEQAVQNDHVPYRDSNVG